MKALFETGRYRYGEYDRLVSDFRWQVPAKYNIGVQMCRSALADPDRIALFYENDDGRVSQHTFGQLEQSSNRLANALAALGVRRGDRVGIALPQRFETGVAHAAVYKLGAISLPLSVMFGQDALSHRLIDSGANVVIASAQQYEIINDLRGELPDLQHVIHCDTELQPLMERGRDSLTPVATAADDPAFLIYTSGTTGPPKGALCAHRCLLGNLTGFELSQNYFPQSRDVFWTPADWAWTGGLLDALIPAWVYGVPILGHEARKFDPERVCHLLAKYRVSNGFVPPTALKMLRQYSGLENHALHFRAIMSAGETVGAELFHWAKECFGVEINEMCGQTECNYIVGNASPLLPIKPGSMGKPYPGHRVDAVDAQGNVMSAGEIGELAAHRNDPVMFLGYWNNPEATRARYRGEYWGLGDLCYRDEEGYLWFLGRDDDVISTAGYRVGPGEVEDALLKHAAVAQCAVIGVDDDLRGQIIKAYIVLAENVAGSDALVAEIQDMVSAGLARHEYPRLIEFIDALPMTTTGKVRRIALRELHASSLSDNQPSS